jgi:hypothetical protein
MHLNGVVTGLGNKAYAELYGRQSESAELIQSLINKGGVIVGKTKLSAFAGSEIPPSQCIDYQSPWNPRGDGYQGPSGSSSGAAAAVAGYTWLDVSIATDSMSIPFLFRTKISDIPSNSHWKRATPCYKSRNLGSPSDLERRPMGRDCPIMLVGLLIHYIRSPILTYGRLLDTFGIISRTTEEIRDVLGVLGAPQRKQNVSSNRF